jgi:hypothetical protein
MMLNGKRCGVLFRTPIGVHLALRHLLLGISVQFASHMTCSLRQHPDGNSTTRQRRSQASIVPLTASTASLAPA